MYCCTSGRAGVEKIKLSMSSILLFFSFSCWRWQKNWEKVGRHWRPNANNKTLTLIALIKAKPMTCLEGIISLSLKTKKGFIVSLSISSFHKSLHYSAAGIKWTTTDVSFTWYIIEWPRYRFEFHPSIISMKLNGTCREHTLTL